MKENCPVYKMVLSTFQRELWDTAVSGNSRLNSVSRDSFYCVIPHLGCPKAVVFQDFNLLVNNSVSQNLEGRTISNPSEELPQEELHPVRFLPRRGQVHTEVSWPAG